jgi:hypothetical protein
MAGIVTVEYYALDDLKKLLQSEEFRLATEGKLYFKTIQKQFGLKTVVEVVDVNGTRKRVNISIDDYGYSVNTYQDGDVVMVTGEPEGTQIK